MRGHNRTHIPRPQRSDSSKVRSFALVWKAAAVVDSSLPCLAKEHSGQRQLPSACFDFFSVSFTTLHSSAPRRRPNDMMTEDADLPKVCRSSSSFARRRRQSIIKLSQQTTPPQQSSSHNNVVVKLRQLSLQSSSTKHSEAQILIAAEQSFNSSLKAAFACLFVAIAIDLNTIYSRL